MRCININYNNYALADSFNALNGDRPYMRFWEAFLLQVSVQVGRRVLCHFTNKSLAP